MKTWKKILLGFFVIIFIGLIAGYFFLKHISNRALPDYNRGVGLKGLKAPVTVYRDDYAVPHIYAENEEDLYRAVGYVMAQDRLWQMDTLRRLTRGRLSEIFGKKLLKTDELMRSLRMPGKAKRMLDKCDPAILELVDAYADGVNQYIEQNRHRLPPEFTILGYEPGKWNKIDSACMAGYMGWGLASPWNWETVLFKIKNKVDEKRFNQLVPHMPRHKPPVFPGFSTNLTEMESEIETSLLSGAAKIDEMGLTVFNASNNWAVSGKRSVTGKPIMANDMHLGYILPGIWYPMHHVVENNGETILDVTGVVLPGQPFIIAGHNRSIAWGMTNVMVDDMDFYLETVNPENKRQYRFNGQWKTMETRKETFKIKGGETIEKTIRFTHRGPVISTHKKTGNHTISMRWIGFEDSNELRSVYLLNRASNWEQFRNAVKTFISVSQNVVYADVEGNIGLQTCAGVPVRKKEAAFVVPGDTDEHDWKGIVPFEQLPYSFNPESGVVSSANNKTAPDDYPYYISNWFDTPDRILRIREMLAEKNRLSVDDFKRMHGDFKSKHVERYLGGILAVLKAQKELDGTETKALDILSKWDGVMSADSAAASIFDTMYVKMVQNLAKDELGDKLFKECMGNKTMMKNLVLNTWTAHRDSPWIDNVNTTEKETFDQWIALSFKHAVRELKGKLGENPRDWQWGKIHTFTLQHPLGRVKILDFLFDFNRGPFQVGGSFHTVCPYGYSFRRPFSVNHGASQRHVYSTADWDASFTVIPAGVSGIPASPYYSDQAEMYTGGHHHPDYFSKQQVIKTAKYQMIFSPVTHDR